jgi:2-amino-4-hydroxy-6-hydroxymethyldihydropteridine diphosphokinase
MHQAYLSLGSNENAKYHLQLAASELRHAFADAVFSPVYRTAAVGFEGPDFLNAAAVIKTELDVIALDKWLHELEDKHGRRRGVPRFSSRCLDIDVIFFDDLIFRGEGNLEIPRPELKYAFVLKPLMDIAEDYREPLSQKTLAQLWQRHVEFEKPMLQESWGL